MCYLCGQNQKNINMNKSNTIKCLCFVAMMLVAGYSAKAQLTHLEQSIYLNFNLPTAQFNDDVMTNALGDQIPMTCFNAGKNAVFGFGLGYRVSYRFDVGFGEVSPYFHGDLQWNRVSGGMRDRYMNAGDGSAPNYFNVPLYVGVNYRYQLTDIFTPFGEFGIGPDFFLITKESGTIEVPASGNPGDPGYVAAHSYDFKLRYQMTCNVAWQIGAGSYFGQHVSASLHYSGYGKHAIKYNGGAPTEDQLANADASVTATQTRSVGMLSLRIGFHF